MCSPSHRPPQNANTTAPATAHTTAWPTAAGFTLPQWLSEALLNDPELTRPRPTLADRADLAIELADRNIRHRTGGPFACVILEHDGGTPFAFGVNLVESANQSGLHGEVVAIALAQARLGRYDLATADQPLQLVTSAAPCAMCAGAIHWCGVRSIVCAARNEDVQAVGFDEGPVRHDWDHYLRDRGVEVIHDIQRPAAAAVLQRYVEQHGRIYNAKTTQPAWR